MKVATLGRLVLLGTPMSPTTEAAPSPLEGTPVY